MSSGMLRPNLITVVASWVSATINNIAAKYYHWFYYRQRNCTMKDMMVAK